ncbi:MAG: leucine-rich repeat protein [Fusicatenibacter sp.]|nr:leucine-rich repeat protein [Fusicatenibacter sp.]
MNKRGLLVIGLAASLAMCQTVSAGGMESVPEALAGDGSATSGYVREFGDETDNPSEGYEKTTEEEDTDRGNTGWVSGKSDSSCWERTALATTAETEAEQIVVEGNNTLWVEADETTIATFVPGESNLWKIYSTGGQDTYGYLYDSEMSLLTSDDDSGEDCNFLIREKLEEGQKYYVGVRFYDSSESGEVTVVIEELVSSGSCGEDLKWSYDQESETLTISGRGAMEDYGDSDAPWAPLSDCVQTVVLSEGITYLGEAAFWEMNYITSVEFPSTLTEIGIAAFGNCSSLCEVQFNEGLEVIDRYAFQNGALTSLELPTSLTEIDPLSFLGNAVTEVAVSEENEYLTEVDNVVFTTDGKTLCYCPEGLTGSYEIPSFVTAVGDYALSGSSFERVTIPESVVTIGERAFTCSDLIGIDIPDSVTAIGDYAFEGCEKAVSATIGSGLTELSYRTFCYCDRLEDVTFGENLESISVLAFAYCPALEEIVIPDSVRYIENGAFGECTGLASVQLPCGLEEIWEQGFFDCGSLEEIIFPETQKKIYAEAFYGTSLISVVIPEGVTYIGTDVFPEGTEVLMSDRLTQLDDGSYMVVGIATVSAQELYSEAFEVLEMVNEERRAEGLQMLSMDRELLETAMLRSSELGIYFAHVRPINQICFTACDKMYGENIAAGQTSASRVMNSWMYSEGHRANILDEDYHSIGIGAAEIDGVIYWAQCFGMEEGESVSESEYKDQASNRDIKFDPEFEELNYGILTDATTLEVGETSSVEFYFDNGATTINIKPEYLAYQSPNERVCTIADGKINAVGSGSAKITVSLPKSPEVAFSSTVTVKGEGGNTETRDNPFVDVKESDYYYDAVLWAYENGITSGTDATHFQPEKTCIRAQVAAFLWRTKGEPEPVTKDNPFVDVKESDYYYDAVLWAYENGITSGTDATHFSPDSTVERAQFVTFLWRAEGKPAASIDNPFVDVPEGQYYTEAVLWAYENGITSGVDATHFKPKNGCTRGQVVTFLYRAYH